MQTSILFANRAISARSGLATSSLPYNAPGLSVTNRPSKKSSLTQESRISQQLNSSKFSSSAFQFATSDSRRGSGEDVGSSVPRLISRCWPRRSLFYLQDMPTGPPLLNSYNCARNKQAAMSKEAVVLAFDQSASASESMNLQTHIGKQLVRGKLLFSKRDEVALITAGGAETNNPLGEDGYQHIDLRCPHRVPDLDMLEEIDEIGAQDHDGVDVDPVDTLMVALQVILDRVGKLKFTKKAFLMSSFAKPIEWMDQLSGVVDRIRDMDAKVNFIILANAEDMSKIQVKNKEFVEKIAGKIPDQVAVFHLNEAFDIVNQFKKKIVRSVPKFKGYLEWHPKLKFRVKTVAKTAIQNMPLLKRISIPAEAAGNDVSDSGVKLTKSYLNKFLETPEERDDSDRVKAYKYGKSYVPFSQVDEKLLQYTSDPCLRVLAFMDSSQVPRHHFMNTVDVVLSEEDDASSKLFYALVTALYEANKVAIMRYVKRVNSDPVIVCASPCSDSEGRKCLYLNQIPFDEDLREYSFSNFMIDERRSVTEAQRNAVHQMIDALDLTKFSENGLEEGDAYIPENTFNPVLQRFYCAVERRALISDSNVELIDEPIKEHLESHRALLSQAEAQINRVSQHFVLNEVPKKAKKSEKRHWRDLMGNIGESEFAVRDIFEIEEKGLGGEQLNLNKLLPIEIREVGKIDPVGDFCKILGLPNIDEGTISKAFEQMWIRIIEFIRESHMGSLFPKSLDALAITRKFSIKHSFVDLYNENLMKLKSDYKEFWNSVVDHHKLEPVLLISNLESPLSKFSPDEVLEVTPAEAEPPHEEAIDEVWDF